MNKEKQKIAIAEACGWSNLQDSDYKPFGKAQLVGRHPGGSDQNLLRVPDYLNDLNAMREAWFNVIFPKPSLCLEYYQNLCTVVETKKDGAHIFGVCLYDKVTNATAAQRAEAFLRTIGKWKE